MKKWLIPIGIIVVLAILFVSPYNSLVEKDTNAEKAWNNVESSYQRRNDLIGNLVKTVQGAADFERGTLTDVIEARSKATSVNVDASNLNAAQIAQFQEAQQGVTSALSRLLVTVERYPDLKANQNFQQLQSQLEGTENRINVARDRFNEAVAEYEKTRRSFPSNITAMLFGFDEMDGFESDPGAENAPDVDFDFE
ncbi:LemA family protein [Gramella sp. AN32]|uniref:LemA family protein n=1 Tax=Christiangramia antarctica TaxID=2058158 RepID=A0ABW5X989_9FLAO|nr:LemA family protein [Gramella sp. AN32]MCM4155277.1 LemA family protein [Gramella sp. AN32]